MASDIPRMIRSRTTHVGTVALGIAATVLLGGCAFGVADPATGPAGLPYEHVHGLGIDPADDTVYVATHDGLFRSDAGTGGLQPADSTAGT